MVLVLLNWLYVLVINLCLGFGVSVVCNKILDYRFKGIDSLLMAGMAISTVYAQIFSLFTGVGKAANIILFVACGLIILLCRREVREYFETAPRKKTIARVVVIAVLVLLWSYFTSRGYIHYDSDLYHAQSIRWIEEYGVVPGLGNLHARFAYNSSFFSLSALYSLKFVVGDSLHTMSGFFALILSITALDIVKSRKDKMFSLSGFARVGLIYYLITIMDEVVSPASDYSIMCIIFFIIIKWLDLLEKDERKATPYALLCVLGVYALTLKLTAGLIILLTIKPVCCLIKEKKTKDIILYLSMGIMVAVPWLVRTVIISGWLLYPFPALDLFDFDWEMNAVMIEADAAQIKTWGRALYDASLVDMPIIQWFPNWFNTMLSGMEKILILGCILSIVIFIVDAIMLFCKKQWKRLDVTLVIGTVALSYLFWQFSAPLIRYGYAYVLLVDGLVIGWLLIRMGWKRLQKLVYFVVLTYGLYKVVAMGQYIYNTRLIESYINPMDYGVYEMDSYEIDGIVFYYPIGGDRAGYDFFPASPSISSIELRGDGLEDGFREAH